MARKSQYFSIALIISCVMLYVSSCQKTEVPERKVIDVERIELDNTSVEIEYGNTLRLKATIYPNDATNKELEWTSDRSDIASVDNSGVVYTTGYGSANIIVRSTGETFVSASCKVTVVPKRVSVTKVALSVHELSLFEGESKVITASVYPSSATDKTLTWSSTSKDVIQLQDDGEIKAIAPGDAYAIVESNDGHLRDSCYVSVSADGFITFKDNAAELACIEKFDKNGDGKLSYQEAASVQSLGNLFENWAGVTTFDEISYFKSLTDIGTAFKGTRITSISLPETIASIPKNAFDRCAYLSSITIPKSVISIGDCAFWGCSSLVSLCIPNSNCTFESSAFYGCSKLKSIDLPSNLESIPYHTFYGCSSLQSINIPKSVNRIGASSFERCTSLLSITIPDGVTEIEMGAFAYCPSLKDISIPASVKTIGYAAFYEVSCWKIDLPGVTKIEGCAFTGIRNIILRSGEFVEIEEDSIAEAFLFVPKDLVESYKLRTVWVKFHYLTYPIESYKDESAYHFSDKQEMIDWGLSVKWSSCNVGASRPEEYGDYYAWGETTPKSTYSKSNYFDYDATSDSYIKYGIEDSQKKTLDLSDDVANLVLQNNARIPTREEWIELFYHSCTEHAKLNGISGFKLWCPASDVMIFLPKSGSRSTSNSGDTTHCFLWASDLVKTSSSQAYSLGFFYDKRYISSETRWIGIPVRPVSP